MGFGLYFCRNRYEKVWKTPVFEHYRRILAESGGNVTQLESCQPEKY